MDQTAPVLTSQKFKYCMWTYLSTFLGGYRFSNEEAGVTISIGTHILQIILYVTFPIIPVIIAASSDNYTVVLVASGVTVTIPITLLNLIAFQREKHNLNTVRIQALADLNKDILLETVKAKPLGEQLTIIVVSALISVLNGSAYYYLFQNDQLSIVVIEALVSATMYPSLYNYNTVEPGVITSTNQSLHPFSCFLLRPKVASFVLKFVLIGDHDEPTGQMSLIFHFIYMFLPLMMIMGLFASFSLLVEYIMEQWNVIMNGGTACGSTQRTGATTVINIIITLLMGIWFTRSTKVAQYVPVIILGVLAIRAKFNFLRSYGLNGTENVSFLFQTSNSYDPIGNILEAVADVIIIIVVLAVQGSKDNMFDVKADDLGILLIICSVIYGIGWLLAQLQRRMFLGLFRSPMINLNKATMIVRCVLTIVQQIYISMASFGSINAGKSTYKIGFIQAVAIQRMYQLSHSNPSMLLIVEIIAHICFKSQSGFDRTYGDYFFHFTILFHVVIRTFQNFSRRIMIWPYAFLKMLTVKKQRVKHFGLLCGAQIIALLPFSFATLLISSVFDLPYAPYLGLPIFTLASFRPKRNWATLERNMKQTSEASVYNSFVDRGLRQIVEKLQQGHMNLQCGQHFLVRMSKYFATIQIVESSAGHLMVVIRGLESQETTSCHGVEAKEVDRMIQEYFDFKSEDSPETYPRKLFNSEVCGTLTPYGRFQVKTYEENQIKMTGIIENEDYVSGFKRIFLMMMCNYAQVLDENDRKMIVYMSDHVFSELFSDRYEQEKVLSYFPDKYCSLIGLKEKFDMQAKTNDEDSSKHPSPKNDHLSKSQTKQNPNQISMVDELGALLDEIDGPAKRNTNQNQNQRTEIRPAPKKDDDDIMGMLDDFDNMFSTKINTKVQPVAQALKKLYPETNEKIHPDSIYSHLRKMIMVCYVLAFNDPNINLEQRVNNQIVYKLFNDTDYISNIRQFKGTNGFSKVFQMIMNSIRAALKISVDIFSIEGTFSSLDETEVNSAFEQMKTDSYIGSGRDKEWIQSLKKQVDTLWSLGFINGQNALVIYRFTQTPVECFVFEMNSDIVFGIQANLQFELYFVTNDDDERYSIQTHQQFLRNMIIESSEEPLGYGPFYSGSITIAS